MKMNRLTSALALLIALCACATGQTVNASQAVVLEGLRASAGHGRFVAAAYAPDGSLLLLYDQGDGIRLIHADATGSTMLGQTRIGAAGDAPVAMALDPAGNVYVTGTTTSGSLSGTSGAVFPAVADSSTNSFVAKFDPNLNLVFLSFLGAGRTAAASVAATADAVFVTGITFSAALPVTGGGIQQAPASGSSENGFVERISADGTTLVYATYLTGVNGNTVPMAIVADNSDRAYVTGSTSATGYPTVGALQPRTLGAISGFLTSLNASGSAFGFSTFIAGGGMSGLALDASTGELLLTGDVALGQFPVATVAMPLVSTSYQTLLRIPVDGQSVSASVLLVPGSQSFVTPDGSGGAWVTGSLGVPLFPGVAPPNYNAGDSFVLHVTPANTLDQTLRLGGVPVNNPNYASLTSSLGAPAMNPAGTTVTVPGMVTATVDASLLASQRFDLPMVQAPNGVLPSSMRDVLAVGCTNSSQCIGTGGLLAQVTTTPARPSLSVSSDDLPNLTLRNAGSSTANGLTLAASGYTLVSDCGATLAASGQCSVALTGSGPGTMTVSAANMATQTIVLGANAMPPNPLALNTRELDFGIVSAVDGTADETVTVTNLSGSSQTFSSVSDGGASAAWSFAQMATTCGVGSAAGTLTLAAGASCTVTLGLTASSSSASDGPVRSAWKIGSEDVVLTAFAQAAALSVSTMEVDFGTQIASAASIRLPRYLYLSNNSNTAVPHAQAGLPAGSPFSVVDGCPSMLEPHSVCQLVLGYAAASAPSQDAAELVLDGGTSVLLTGETLPQTSVTGSAANPSLGLSTSAVAFATAVAVTQVSGSPQTVTVTNTGTSAFALTLAISGDFTLTSGCPAMLAAGASCPLRIGFAPSQPGQRDGVLSVAAGSGFTPSYVALTGVGSAILPANDGTLTVGQTYVGEPLVAWYQVQQALTSLTVSSSASQFGVALVQDTGSGHGTLPAGSFGPSATASCNHCWLGVQYLSQTAGTQTAQLTLTSNAGGSAYVLGISGAALPVQGLLLSPIVLDFGPVAVHSSSGAATFTLANLLGAAAGATVQTVAASGDFAVVANTNGGAPCTGTLGMTDSCFVQVSFSPTATGSRSGTLTVVTSGGTATAALSGYGLADPGLAVAPTSITFSNVPNRTATKQTVMLTNTGTTALTLGQLDVSDPSFAASTGCSTLVPGAVCTVVVAFTPQAAQTAGTLSIPVSQTVNGQVLSTVYPVALTGAYTTQTAGLQIVPDAVNFGSAATGAQSETRTFTLNNLSGKTLAVSFAMPREFPLATPPSCTTLAVGASCEFAVEFDPLTAGALTGTVVANGVPVDGSAAVQTLAYMLGYGAGTGSLTVSEFPIPNGPVSFGQVTSGQSEQQTLMLTNSGSGALTIHRIGSQPPFYSTSNCGSALAMGASCQVTLTYAPVDESAAGDTATPRLDNGVLTIESDATTSPDAVALSGVAVPVVSASPASSAVLDAFSLSDGALTFANTQVGSASATQTVTLTNIGTATIHVLAVTVPVDFGVTTGCGTLLPGATCSIAVTFAPTAGSPASVRAGALEISSDASTSLEYVSLLGATSEAPLTLSPSALDFGTVSVGASDALTLTVTNTLATPVTFGTVTAGGDYAVTGGTCTVAGLLAGGASCTLQVSFTPSAAGTRAGTLNLATNATQLPLTVSLTGIGAQGQLQVTPGALAFGSIAVGAPASLTLTLLNTGGATLTGIGNALNGPYAADFAVTVPCATTTLAPNQGCTETVTFTPQALGARTATLTVTSSDPQGPATVALSGTGASGVTVGSFALTVNGGGAATVTVSSGAPAAFPLVLTPLNGFNGTVALTCAAVRPGLYASCSVSPSTLTVHGAAMTSTATINTITSSLRGVGVGMSVLLGMIGFRRGKKGIRSVWTAVLAFAPGLSVAIWLVGCGSGPSSSKVLYTPAGTYQYQVTASSTSGVPISSTVTLNVVVQ